MEKDKYWKHDWDPFLFKFPESFPVEGIRWYGLAYVLGFIAAACLLNWYYTKKKSPLNPEAQTSLLTAIIIGTILGGRLGYMLFYNLEAYMQDPLSIFKVWQGGMASHGGFIGITIAIWYFAKKNKIEFRKLTDIVVTLGTPGVFFGRIANFINGELYGKVTDVFFAVRFPEIVHYPTGPLIVYTDPRHPSQIYQALLEGLILFMYTQMRFWKSSRTSTNPGHLTGEFLIAYAILRSIGELFREPDASLILGISRGTFYSLFLLIGGISFILYSRVKGTNLQNP